MSAVVSGERPVRGGVVTLSTPALDALMPMHLRVAADGQVMQAGPTLRKLLGQESVAGRPLFDLLEIRRPVPVCEMAGLRALSGGRLALALRSAPHLLLRGVAAPLPEEAGMILDLSLGLSFQRAVAEFGLTLGDFSPCDQTIELLYLSEANASIARLSRHLTERLRAARLAAESQALTDALTGLANRRAMDLAVERQLADPETAFAVLHIDLDLFKAVNDTHGHAAGDRVLQVVGAALRGDLRRGDLAGRIGGDEFLVLLDGAAASDALAATAARLIARMEAPVEFDGVELRISASIGIARSVDYARRPSPDEMLADTDMALYRAKHGGRGRFALHGQPDPAAPAPARRRADAG